MSRDSTVVLYGVQQPQDFPSPFDPWRPSEPLTPIGPPVPAPDAVRIPVGPWSKIPSTLADEARFTRIRKLAEDMKVVAEAAGDDVKDKGLKLLGHYALRLVEILDGDDTGDNQKGDD